MPPSASLWETVTQPGSRRLFSSVGGGTYFEDDTMRNGNGDANGWSGNLGGGNHWYRLQRAGNQFTSSVSMDGLNWTVVNTTNLPNFGSTIYAGVFIHALQSFNPNIHTASFDSFSLTGANVIGPSSVSITPLTNAVIGGLPTTFTASVVGPVPTAYQWQLDGTNILDATNASYSIPSAAPADAGNYTVTANGVTSVPATLIISAPAGSGVWTNLNGGSWSTSNNWSGGFTAGGTDAVADFSTLDLSLNPVVTLDGARTVGTLVFDDLNPVNQHNWTLNAGSGETLTLAVSSEMPNIAVKNTTNTINAVLAGTQGFSKTGAGYLTLSAPGTFTGTVRVNGGTLEVQNKSGDTPYSVASGATLKIGYSTGGGYANTSLTISGNGVSDLSGFYLKGGKNYNSSGQIVLQSAPTTIRQFGSGFASIGTFDINGIGLWCTAAASGSVLDSNIQVISSGYGMSMQVDSGINTATGDLTINGPLNVGSLGFYKRGDGSLRLNSAAPHSNVALQIQGGTVICGAANCIGANAVLLISAGGTLDLNGFSQIVAFSSGAGTTKLGGNLILTINKGGTPNSSVLSVGGAIPLTLGGTLTVKNIGAALTAGDTFVLFNAASYAGNFNGLDLPPLPAGLIWDTTELTANGSITVATVGSNIWNGGGGDNNWSTPANWSGGLPANGELLTFSGTLRQSSINNLVSSVGQVAFGNGGFLLSGNPVTLHWGLQSQTGNNTWAINTTLDSPQSFISSNGNLAVNGTVNNGGSDLTLDGPANQTLSGVVSGAGGLIKSGAGIATLSAIDTYSGGTVVNAGQLNLSANNGASGTISGSLTVNPGATVTATAANALGYADSSWVRTLNIAGGTFTTTASGDQGWGLTVNLTGGALVANGAGSHFAVGGGWTINTLATNVTSTVSGNLVLRESNPNNQLVFNVASGTASPDLLASSVISQAANGYGIAKEGPGVLSLTGASTYTGATAVNDGTLLVNGSLAAGSIVEVSPGGTLGGTGVINGPVIVQNGGTLAPGNNGIGTLTINHPLTLAGDTVMEISRNGGVPTNDVALINSALTQGGRLIVTNIGTNALITGDSFKLFSALSYVGVFSNLALPNLSAGLIWNTNGLGPGGTLFVTNIAYRLSYTAGTNGGISGTTPQTASYGGNGSAVTAVPNPDYFFADWSDGILANPRTDSNVTNNITVTANFLPVNLARPVILPDLGAEPGGSFSFQFTGTLGQHYRVEFTPEFPAPGPWQVLTDISSLASSPFVVFHSLTNTQGFYRVGFVP